MVSTRLRTVRATVQQLVLERNQIPKELVLDIAQLTPTVLELKMIACLVLVVTAKLDKRLACQLLLATTGVKVMMFHVLLVDSRLLDLQA